jgi:uncharacterized protein (TIGR02145 family)
MVFNKMLYYVITNCKFDLSPTLKMMSHNKHIFIKDILKSLSYGLLFICLILNIYSCHKEEILQITTATGSSITHTTAISGGKILYDGKDTFISRGICWSKLFNPTINSSKTIENGGTGSFVSNLTLLSANTLYYVRAYVKTSAGTFYGNQVSFKTLAYGPINFNPGLTYGTITDIEGNAYKTIQIGTQVWMAENLKTTKLNDGTPIPQVTDATTWDNLSSPACCWYNDEATTYNADFGALYNWYVVNTSKLCPTGWHLPTDAEWTALSTYLGGQGYAGGKLKEISTTHWLSPNTGSTNESGFTALPGGTRSISGSSDNIDIAGYWWSSTEFDSANAWYRHMNYSTSNVFRNSFHKKTGFSVRCVKDN